MQATIDWPYKEGILATTKICCVHVRTPSTRTFIDQTARITLVYDTGPYNGTYTPVVQPRHTPVLEGSDCFDGVTISDDGTATFRVKINALSSQHSKASFMFQVTVNDKICTTESFITLSKPIRTEKRTTKRKRSSESDDEASTTSAATATGATGTSTDTLSEDDYDFSELGAFLDHMMPSENMSISDIRRTLHDIHVQFVNMSHKMQMIVKSLQNLRE
ncbi:MAG: hypothetical protein CL608_30045 [Anaerolineaceae bacterium]|nr:hypothetical protein [Anaerolineaceae bacterium]|tara:strand:+ start:4196 stop:4852 length:657 start_codon:yes stop_codon:yes gene_type:complete